jgi:hypothetical protein
MLSFIPPALPPEVMKRMDAGSDPTEEVQDFEVHIADLLTG